MRELSVAICLPYCYAHVLNIMKEAKRGDPDRGNLRVQFPASCNLNMGDYILLTEIVNFSVFQATLNQSLTSSSISFIENNSR